MLGTTRNIHSHAGSCRQNRDRRARTDVAKTPAFCSILLAAAIMLSGCSAGSSDDIVGNWSASDGTTKTIMSNGVCTGMYYYQGKPLDIGGGMICSYSKDRDGSGTHMMVVSQPPNQASFRIKFPDSNTAQMLDPSGALIVTLKRR